MGKALLWLVIAGFTSAAIEQDRGPHPGGAPAGPKRPQCDMKIQKIKMCIPCEKEITDPKKDLEKGKCVKCKGEIKEVEFCIKKAYRCGKCAKEAFKKEKCCDKKSMEEFEDKARAVFVCEMCGTPATDEKSRACGARECPKKGAKLVKTCSKAGTFPHVLK